MALIEIWDAIGALGCSAETKQFLQDVFLSIIPQAKFRDYRGKSQDLHPPPVQLREVNLLYRFEQQLKKRRERLEEYPFSVEADQRRGPLPIECSDFRDFFGALAPESVDLVLTDPAWVDGNAYLEKAQLYHPWLGYSLRADADRLAREFVITDAPTRRAVHNDARWWADLETLFERANQVLKANAYFALYFRPSPGEWLAHLNRLKLVGRRQGFEPLLSIDVGAADPSMRIQQSASYVFSGDIIFLFLKLRPEIRRIIRENVDVDQLAYQTGEQLQEEQRGPFSYREWRDKMSQALIDAGLARMNAPVHEAELRGLFERYTDEVSPGQYLVKAVSPFSGQLFDESAVERVFTYVPHVIKELTRTSDTFSFDNFLLSLSTFVENGTRMLINEIEQLNFRRILEMYAEPLQGGRYFRLRPLPTLPEGLKHVMELDPYEFEAFVGRLLREQGFTSIAIVGRSGDRGVDISCIDPTGNKTVVQCKHYSQATKVDSTAIQRLHSFAVTRAAERKICVTTADFSAQAYQEAHITDTETVNGEQLEAMIATYLPDYFG